MLATCSLSEVTLLPEEPSKRASKFPVIADLRGSLHPRLPVIVFCFSPSLDIVLKRKIVSVEKSLSLSLSLCYRYGNLPFDYPLCTKDCNIDSSKTIKRKRDQ